MAGRFLIVLAAAVSVAGCSVRPPAPPPASTPMLYEYVGHLTGLGEVRGFLTLTARGEVVLDREPTECRPTPLGGGMVSVACAGRTLRLRYESGDLGDRALLEVQLRRGTQAGTGCYLREPDSPSGEPGRCIATQSRGGVRIERLRGTVEVRRASE